MIQLFSFVYVIIIYYYHHQCMAPNGRCKFEEWKEQESAALRGFQRFRQFREECASNYLSRWFCGMGKECHEDGVRSRVLLERAKRTVAEGTRQTYSL